MAFYDKFILGQIDARLGELEASANNRPSFGPGSLSGKLLRPKSIISQLIDVDTLSSVNANTGNLSISGTLTIGSGGSIVDADGSTWDQTGLTLVAAGAIGDALTFEVGSDPKVAHIIYSDLGAGDSLLTLRNYEDYAAYVASSTVTNTAGLHLRVDDVTAANNYAALIGIGPTLTGAVYATGAGTVVVDGDTITFRNAAGTTLATIVSSNKVFTSYGRIFPGDGTTTPNTTGYLDWNTTPTPDRMRIVGANLEVPGLFFETTSSLATYLTFQDGSNPAVTFGVDGTVGTTGARLLITADHSDAGREAYLDLIGTGSVGLFTTFNAGDSAGFSLSVAEDLQQASMTADNNTNGETAIYLAASDTATTSKISFLRNGSTILELNGTPNTDVTLGALVGQILVQINGSATQYYIPYYAA